MNSEIKLDDLSKKISIKQREIQTEQDVNRRYRLYKELRTLELRKEIELIKKKIEALK